MLRSLAFTLLALALFAAGWLAEGWRMTADIERLQRAHAEERARDASESASELRRAAQRSDALQARVAAEENTRQKLTEEKNDALRRLTVGRPCLDSAAVRLLNQPTGLAPAALPAAPGQPLPADAAFATDTDVGLWANGARRSYDTCRGRLDAIADFYTQDKNAR